MSDAIPPAMIALYIVCHWKLCSTIVWGFGSGTEPRGLPVPSRHSTTELASASKCNSFMILFSTALKSPAAFHEQRRSLERARVRLPP